MSTERKRIIGSPRRVVVKVGSATLSDGAGLHRRTVARLAEEIASLHAGRRRVVLVSSGAIAVGLTPLGLRRRPRDVVTLQAAAAAGQVRLMERWARAFARHDLQVAQVLLTHEDVGDRKRYLNARHTLGRLLKAGLVPVVNENDTVGTEELRVGDNDQLAALCVGLVGADLLVLLSDVDGVHDGDPRHSQDAERISLLELDDPRFAQLRQGSGGKAHATALGTGGMRTKLQAARMAAELGVPAVIAAGRTPGILGGILQGEDLGTLVPPRPSRLAGRKGWLAHATRPRGRLVVDGGAKRAITTGGKSLLPAGVTSVEGSFAEGDVVELAGPDGEVFAQGLATYGAEAVRQIQGQKTSEIARLLGYQTLEVVVHRDELVLL
ncbi:MAG: glutamate 5-kinase [Deltaproteobacteria bacterium]|nr:glutamate 5-kinase [Deltaproteobacteria bacterium]